MSRVMFLSAMATLLLLVIAALSQVSFAVEVKMQPASLFDYVTAGVPA